MTNFLNLRMYLLLIPHHLKSVKLAEPIVQQFALRKISAQILAIALLKKPDTLGINYMRFVIKMEFFIRLIFHLQMFMM